MYTTELTPAKGATWKPFYGPAYLGRPLQGFIEMWPAWNREGRKIWCSIPDISRVVRVTEPQ